MTLNTEMIIELIGYLGSILVVVSMLMVSVVKLRTINLIGSSIFAGYALVIRSYPTAFMNLCLAVINIYNLVRILKVAKNYDLVEAEPDGAFVTYILNNYKEDILQFFPDFCWDNFSVNTAYIVCTDGNPAGLLLGKKTESHTMEIALDYTTPAYRDCSVGEYLYDAMEKKGIREMIIRGVGEKHQKYLEKMGWGQITSRETVEYRRGSSPHHGKR